MNELCYVCTMECYTEVEELRPHVLWAMLPNITLSERSPMLNSVGCVIPVSWSSKLIDSDKSQNSGYLWGEVMIRRDHERTFGEWTVRFLSLGAGLMGVFTLWKVTEALKTHTVFWKHTKHYFNKVVLKKSSTFHGNLPKLQLSTGFFFEALSSLCRGTSCSPLNALFTCVTFSDAPFFWGMTSPWDGIGCAWTPRCGSLFRMSPTYRWWVSLIMWALQSFNSHWFAFFPGHSPLTPDRDTSKAFEKSPFPWCYQERTLSRSVAPPGSVFLNFGLTAHPFLCYPQR